MPKPSANNPTSNNTDIGNTGEQLVCRALQQRQWVIVAQQWRCRWGELDIVARRGDRLAFVEVKTRSPRNWDSDGRLAIAPRKQQKLVRAARAFLQKHPQYAELACQFDVALVKRRSSQQYELETYLPAAFDASAQS
ncbi:YraN family protein [Synechococcus sp. PCC 7336]|uniref:YraN family protein n=1 Tax=Synechococcus sp. PCC 7336 TaxID=195250 RepID=UPI0003448B78|nr:YraN family protein [Synechococcus sp. PCC 7336]